ncbi:MAG TPA: hypothetical protein PK295_04725 [Candidatus Magasanikbacteria bacterium]|nr:hypothetical protein [Candidatus Magasanikbacteria bacterium]
MEQGTSVGLAMWQIINFAIFVGLIYAIVTLVRNSRKTVKSLSEVETKLHNMSEKVDSLLKK